jgi:recombination protein RecA
MDIRRIGSLKDGERVVGNRTRVKVVKNKVAAPFRDAEFDIVYNEGISREGELLDVGVDRDLVQKLGTWLSFGDERLGQGRENARLYLKEHADTRAKLERKVRELLGLAPAAAAPAPAPAPGAAAREVALAGAGAGRGAPPVKAKR